MRLGLSWWSGGFGWEWGVVFEWIGDRRGMMDGWCCGGWLLGCVRG